MRCGHDAVMQCEHDAAMQRGYSKESTVAGGKNCSDSIGNVVDQSYRGVVIQGICQPKHMKQIQVTKATSSLHEANPCRVEGPAAKYHGPCSSLGETHLRTLSPPGPTRSLEVFQIQSTGSEY
jgi:hypothetical protein